MELADANRCEAQDDTTLDWTFAASVVVTARIELGFQCNNG